MHFNHYFRTYGRSTWPKSRTPFFLLASILKVWTEPNKIMLNMLAAEVGQAWFTRRLFNNYLYGIHTFKNLFVFVVNNIERCPLVNV